MKRGKWHRKYVIKEGVLLDTMLVELTSLEIIFNHKPSLPGGILNGMENMR
jgi:hypothetical protein